MSITVCLLPSEPIEVGYDHTSYTTQESTGNVSLTMKVISHPITGAPIPFALIVKTRDGNASMFPLCVLYLSSITRIIIE